MRLLDPVKDYSWIAESPRARAAAEERLSWSYHSWHPRPDKPENFDQQWSYVNEQNLVSFALGGNASGKTSASAMKCAQFLCGTLAPRPDTPFWIISEQYYQSCSVCWKEKLCDQHFLPPCNVDWERIVWYKPDLGWPFFVPLKKQANGNNWLLEFKSFGQGRAAMQARSIGGFWFSEQFPWDLFIETLRGCREYMFKGGQFAEFTPIDPELCINVEKMYDNPPAGWKFYRLNVDENRKNLAADWYDSFFSSVPEEMMATRKTGALATFEGTIYQLFNPAVHVVSSDDRDPVKQEIANKPWLGGTYHHRGIDWGASTEHPFVVTWSCYDGAGEWLTYDEYWCNQQDKTLFDHAVEVVTKSCLWGWPEPTFFRAVDMDRSLPEDVAAGRDLNAMKKIRRAFVDTVRARVREQWQGGLPPLTNRIFGQSFADPSRPGELVTFNEWGISTSMASNAIFKGIDCMRALLKVNPTTGRARHYIDKRCTHLIEETRKYRWDKKRPNLLFATSLKKPAPLKKDDDACFPAGQMVDTPHGLIAIEQIRPGDTVFSHRGVAAVVKNWIIKESELIAVYLNDGRHIICTSDHKLAVSGGGWVEAGKSLGLSIDCRKGGVWKSFANKRDLANVSSWSGTADLIGEDIPIPRCIPAAIISEDSRERTDNSARSGCINKCGLTTTAPFLLDWTSTIATKIQRTTTSEISCSSIDSNTPESTKTTSRRLNRPLRNGTEAKRATNGTSSTQSSAGKSRNSERKYANSAVSHTIQNTLATASSARISANQLHDARRRLILLNALANSAASYSRLTGTQRRARARRNVQPVCVGRIERLSEVAPVYNLATTDGTFFVSGVLVSNCDANRYGIYSVETLRGMQPTSTTEHDPSEHRNDVFLDRPDNGHRRIGPMDAGANGFFRKVGR